MRLKLSSSTRSLSGSQRSNSREQSSLSSPKSNRYAALQRSSSSEGVTESSDLTVNLSATTTSVANHQLTKKRASCQPFCCHRLPKGRSSLLIFVLNVIESFAFYSAVDGALDLIFRKVQSSDLGNVISLALQNSVGRLAYPLAGIVADVYLGRYTVIHIGLWVLLVAHCVLAMTLSLNGYLSGTTGRYVLGVLAYAFVSVGSASIEANIIPFGVDQLSPGPSSAEMSSYFYLYYFGRQLGGVLSVLVFLGLAVVLKFLHISNDSSLYKALTSLPSLLVVLMLVIAILMHFYLKNWYFRDIARPNPLKLVFNVLWYAATARRQYPRHRRAFRYGEKQKPRIELAKIDYDGIYDRGDVEDVKTIFRIVLFLFSLCGYSVTYTGALVMLYFQIGNFFKAVTHIDSNLQTYLNISFLCNSLTIMLCLPILNHMVLPCIPRLNMKRRIGVGMIINVAAVAVAAILEATVHKRGYKIQLLLFLVPVVLIAIGEAFVIVTTLEFIYAQTPENTKGFLTGTFYSFWGVFSIGGLLLFYFILYDYPFQFPNKSTVKGLNPIMWYYVMLCGIGAVGFAMYVVTAYLYTYRQRPNLPDDERECTRRRNAGEWSFL